MSSHRAKRESAHFTKKRNYKRQMLTKYGVARVMKGTPSTKSGPKQTQALMIEQVREGRWSVRYAAAQFDMTVDDVCMLAFGEVVL